MRIQLLSKSARVPSRAHSSDAGYDLYAAESVWISPGSWGTVSTDVILEIPDGHVGLICPRSGLAASYAITVLNAPGVIDSGYRGAVKVNLINHGKNNKEIRIGDRIGQLLIQKVELPVLELVDDLDSQITDRGSKGHGSTGQ